MTHEPIIPAGMEPVVATSHYSPAVRVGTILYCSGQVGRDHDLQVIADPERQYRAAFDNVGRILTTAGATFADVFQLDTFHVSFDDFELFQRVKDDYLTAPPWPAWTGVGVDALALPELLVEIRCLATLPR